MRSSTAYTASTAFPPEPTKVRALEMIESGGGSAANAAVAIARLGGRAELWARVGDDEAGAKVRDFLEADGVDIALRESNAGGRTSTSAVIVDAEGERLIVGERDHAMSLDPSWLAARPDRRARVPCSPT